MHCNKCLEKSWDSDLVIEERDDRNYAKNTRYESAQGEGRIFVFTNEIDRGLHKRALDNIEFVSDNSLVE